jgi:hypothetical protein
MTNGSLWVVAAVMTLFASVSGQGNEKHSLPEKVTSAMMQEQATGTAHQERAHEADAHAARDSVAERDVATIRSDVKRSRTFIVIKALALAVAIVGPGVVYVPRRTGGSS